jgi:hypothetical protein
MGSGPSPDRNSRRPAPLPNFLALSRSPPSPSSRPKHHRPQLPQPPAAPVAAGQTPLPAALASAAMTTRRACTCWDLTFHQPATGRGPCHHRQPHELGPATTTSGGEEGYGKGGVGVGLGLSVAYGVAQGEWPRRLVCVSYFRCYRLTHQLT